MPLGGLTHHVGVVLGLLVTWLLVSPTVNALRERTIVGSHHDFHNQISEATYNHVYRILLVTNTNLDTMLQGKYLEWGIIGDHIGGWLSQPWFLYSTYRLIRFADVLLSFWYLSSQVKLDYTAFLFIKFMLAS